MKVKYKKNGMVSVEMPLKNYKDLLTGYNELSSALLMMMDCHTIYLSDVGKLETFKYKLQHSLGFVVGEGYYSDATLPHTVCNKEE
jgi:hypothetical protein